MERLDEYRTHNAQFCKRMLDFLSIMFTAQVNNILQTNYMSANLPVTHYSLSCFSVTSVVLSKVPAESRPSRITRISKLTLNDMVVSCYI